MYVIRETFHAKPGMASKLAKMFKETMNDGQAKTRVLTDSVGDFNTVVLETEVDDIGGFSQRMKEYQSRPEIRDRMKGYTDMYVTGRREIYQVV